MENGHVVLRSDDSVLVVAATWDFESYAITNLGLQMPGTGSRVATNHLHSYYVQEICWYHEHPCHGVNETGLTYGQELSHARLAMMGIFVTFLLAVVPRGCE